jgi:hypothetical protein
MLSTTLITIAVIIVMISTAVSIFAFLVWNGAITDRDDAGIMIFASCAGGVFFFLSIPAIFIILIFRGLFKLFEGFFTDVIWYSQQRKKEITQAEEAHKAKLKQRK